MTDRWARLAPLTGIAFVLLFVGAAVAINEWEYLPAGEELVEQYTDNSNRILLGGYLGMAAGFFLVWFAGSVRARLREAEGAPGRLAAVAFGGGVGAAAVNGIGFSAIIAAASRAGDTAIGVDNVVALHDLAGTVAGTATAVMLGVMLAAAGVVGLRTGTFARWFSWASLVSGILLASPISWMVIFLAPLWILWMSIAMYREQSVVAAS